MLQQTPIFSDVAKFFAYPVVRSSATAAIPITAPFGTNAGYINLMPQNNFVLTSFRCVTNYDNVGGLFDTAVIAAPVLLGPPFVPNNFTVKIARGQSNTYSSQPLTQAEICSSGTLAGKQFPFPVVYGPKFNFSFEFTDLSGLYLFSDADPATRIPLQIEMWMVGYSVPLDQWGRFVNYFPALVNVYNE